MCPDGEIAICITHEEVVLMESTVFDVTKLVDEQKVGAFTVRVVVISFMVMLFDGYDLLAASYSAPALIADWHIPPAQLGPVFSASPLGMLVGAQGETVPYMVLEWLEGLTLEQAFALLREYE